MLAAEAGADLGAKEPPGKAVQGPFQVRHGDVPAHRQTLHLVELDLGPRGDLLVAVAHSRQDHPDGSGWYSRMAWICPGEVWVRRTTLVGGVEGVPHIPGGMMRRHVEQLEVVLVGDHVGAPVDLEAHVPEHPVHLAHHHGGGVEPATAETPSRQGHVQGLGAQTGLQLSGLDHLIPVLEGLCEARFRLVEAPAEVRAFLPWHLAHHPGEKLDLSLLPQEASPPESELLGRVGPVQSASGPCSGDLRLCPTCCPTWLLQRERTRLLAASCLFRPPCAGASRWESSKTRLY